MPKIAREIIVNAPIDATWALVSDMERFSLCIPGCKEVKKVSETEFDWVMEAKVLRTTRRVTARTRAAVMKPPSHSEFIGEGRLFERSNHYKLSITGTTDLEELSPRQTRIRFEGNVTAGGVGGAIIDKVASGQMEELFGEFESKIKEALGDTQPAAAPESPPAGKAAAGWLGVPAPFWIGAAVLAAAGIGVLLLAR